MYFGHGHSISDASLEALTLHFSYCQTTPSSYKKFPNFCWSDAQSRYFCLISVGRLTENPSQIGLIHSNEVQFLYRNFFLMDLIHFFHTAEIILHILYIKTEVWKSKAVLPNHHH